VNAVYVNVKFKCINNTEFTCLCNLASTDYKFSVNDEIASKRVGAV